MDKFNLTENFKHFYNKLMVNNLYILTATLSVLNDMARPIRNCSGVIVRMQTNEPMIALMPNLR